MREKIIESIKKELAQNDKYYTPSSWRYAVYYLPDCGEFIYNDSVVNYSVIQLMIKDKTLIYDGIKMHQGELMPRYILNKNLIE